MDVAGSNYDSRSDTEKLKQEKTFEEAIIQGIDRANEHDTSVQYHEDSVPQFSLNGRGHFETTEHMRQAVKEHNLKN